MAASATFTDFLKLQGINLEWRGKVFSVCGLLRPQTENMRIYFSGNSQLNSGPSGCIARKIFKANELEVDTNSKTVSIENKLVNLTRKEFEILSLLLKHQGQYLEREEILNRIWSDNVIVTERNVDVNIARLRKKIGKYGDYVKGKSGYGYCFSIQ